MGRILGSIPVDGFITPRDSNNIYATHIAEYGKGGFHSVKTLEDRDMISLERLNIGMGVYVADNEQIYMLKSYNKEDGTEREWGSFFKGSGVVPDWDQTDEGAVDYIVNRPDIGTIEDFRSALEE